MSGKSGLIEVRSYWCSLFSKMPAAVESSQESSQADREVGPPSLNAVTPGHHANDAVAMTAVQKPANARVASSDWHLAANSVFWINRSSDVPPAIPANRGLHLSVCTSSESDLYNCHARISAHGRGHLGEPARFR